MTTTQQTKLPPFTMDQTLDLMKQHSISAMWPVTPEEVLALINAAGQLCRWQAIEDVISLIPGGDSCSPQRLVDEIRSMK